MKNETTIQQNNLFKIKTDFEIQTKIDWFLESLNAIEKDFCEAFDINDGVVINYNKKTNQFVVSVYENGILTQKLYTIQELKNAIITESQKIYNNDAERVKGVDKKEKLRKEVFNWGTNKLLRDLDNTME